MMRAVFILLIASVLPTYAGGTYAWILDYRNGKSFNDSRAVGLLKEVAPSDWQEEIFDRMTIPPSLDTVFGDSVALFSSCKYQSCDEKLAFAFDLKANIGVFVDADRTDAPSSALILSRNCTREAYENRYRTFFDSWKLKEKILVSSEVFWMKPTSSDTALMKAHDVALKEFKSKKPVSTLNEFLQSANRSPKLYGSFNIAAKNDLGYFLEQANRAAEAIPVLEEVVAFDPTRTPAFGSVN